MREYDEPMMYHCGKGVTDTLPLIRQAQSVAPFPLGYLWRIHKPKMVLQK